jgi:hypothetical protein
MVRERGPGHRGEHLARHAERCASREGRARVQVVDERREIDLGVTASLIPETRSSSREKEALHLC